MAVVGDRSIDFTIITSTPTGNLHLQQLTLLSVLLSVPPFCKEKNLRHFTCLAISSKSLVSSVRKLAGDCKLSKGERRKLHQVCVDKVVRVYLLSNASFEQ